MRVFLNRALLLPVIILLLARGYSETFKNPRIIPTSSDPTGVAAADFNGDGKPDLAYVDGTTYSTRVLHVLLGNGDGTFSHGQDINLPIGTCGLRCQITVADVTADGKLDIIMGSAGTSTASVVVLVGNGDGTFGQPIVSSFSYGSTFPNLTGRLGVADVNGDGAIDLVVADGANYQIYVLLGNKTGRFQFSRAMFAQTAGVYLADLNGDGKLDIVSLGDIYGAPVYVYLGNGDGTFGAGVYFGAASGLILTDLDGDGHPDLVGTKYPNQLVFFKGKPDGTFAPAVALGTTSMPIYSLAAVADLNSDGNQDVVVLNPAGVGVLLGQAGLTLGPMQSFVMGNASSFSVAVADFNGDRHPDFAVGTVGGIAIMLGVGDGTFASGGDLYDMGGAVGSAAVGDFNGDGLSDIAVTLPGPAPRLLLGIGGGKFTLAPDPNSSYPYSSAGPTIAAGDFNGDGKLDLAVALPTNGTAAGSPNVFLGNGNGTFSAPIPISNGVTAIADVNHDSSSDIISVTNASSSIAVLLGTSDASFPQVVTSLRNPLYPQLLGIGDVNRDGKPDVIIGSNNGSGGMIGQVWTGNGDGSFTYANTLPAMPSGQIESGALTDLDGDGNVDLVVVLQSNNSATLGVFYGNSDGTFQSAVVSPLARLYTRMSVADVNQDGRPDLILDDGSLIAVIPNLGNRTFDQEFHYVAGAVLGSVVVADVNGDGFPDIVVANSTPNSYPSLGATVVVLLNDPNGSPPGGESISRSITISPEPSQYGQSFAVNISTSAPRLGLPVPTGSVTVTLDGLVAGKFALQAGAATFTGGSNLSPGTHAVIITYNGDAVYRPASFSLQHYINPPVYSTQTNLSVTPTSTYAGQTVRLTATVTSAASPVKPLGIVTFYDGADSIGSRIFNFIPMGPADPTLTVLDTALLTPGVHSITAAFDGYSIHNTSYWETLAPSRSNPTRVTVNSIPTTTALALSSATPTAGAVETLMATVTAAAGVPFGSVTFYDSGTVLATMALKPDSTATYSLSWPASGNHNLVAIFNPNGAFAQSSSAMLTVPVAASNLVRTYTSLLPLSNGPQPSTSTLIAKVEADGAPVEGEVTFLDRGSIIGTAKLDPAGLATIVFGSAAGTNILSASFTGTSTSAPSVSPTIEEQGLQGGPGFLLAVEGTVLDVPTRGSASLAITVAPAADFRSTIEFACEGVPKTYTCSFAPSSLTRGGVRFLTIASTRGAPPPPSSLWRHLGREGIFIVAVLAVFVTAHGRRRPLLFMLTCGFAIALAGCGAMIGRQSQGSNAAVIIIRATSMQGSDLVVHSAQVVLHLGSSR